MHDESLQFQPIHRAIFGVGEEFVKFMADRLTKIGGDSKVKVVYADKEYYWSVSDNASDAIADIQQLMDEYNSTQSAPYFFFKVTLSSKASILEIIG